MAVCHLYPTHKIYKGGHETPRVVFCCGNMEGTWCPIFVGVYFHEHVIILCRVWPAAPKSVCILCQKLLSHVICAFGMSAGPKS